MTEIQYGIGHNRALAQDAYTWTTSRDFAESTIAELGGGRYLVAREVGVPYEVKELPTTPGSVILAGGILLFRRNNNAYRWVKEDTQLVMDSEIAPDWTLLFDAGAVSE